uniref:CSN8/PSMD8/EIF3K domain-containing protein n=1 Tax=Canis lupus dingo TaxID=286419 RepID=A0A8C0QSV0_CANLU
GPGCDPGHSGSSPVSGSLHGTYFSLFLWVAALKGKWNRKSHLKLVLLELNFLSTTGTQLTKQQFILAGNILEIGAQWSILCKDVPSFQHYMTQLKCYYFNCEEQLSESADMHQLSGLNFLFLLSQNRVAEFHTRVGAAACQGHADQGIYIKRPVSLQQYVMERSYHRVFLAKGNIPAESYTFFTDILLDTLMRLLGASRRPMSKCFSLRPPRSSSLTHPKRRQTARRSEGDSGLMLLEKKVRNKEIRRAR